MTVNNGREKTIYKQGYMSGCNTAQAALKAAERRAEIAEKALYMACCDLAKIYSPCGLWADIAVGDADNYLKQAEKELAEEEKMRRNGAK